MAKRADSRFNWIASHVPDYQVQQAATGFDINGEESGEAKHGASRWDAPGRAVPGAGAAFS
jgi:hypothetical protein